ncbi:hypothetical protein JOD24_002451 [Kroppenstedtia sanguinis]
MTKKGKRLLIVLIPVLLVSSIALTLPPESFQIVSLSPEAGMPGGT